MTAGLDLPRTRAAIERGRARGLHLGGQAHVAHRGRSADLIAGERQPGQAMTVDTLNVWLSSTKPVAAVALAILWERGALDLDDPIARFVPEFAAEGKGAITLRHALTHTGGFRMLDVGWPNASWEEIVAKICAARPEPRWPLGDKAGYHIASSWFVLGEVARRIDGRDFSRFVRQELFEPLGMLDSWIGMPPDRFVGYGERIGWMWSTEGETPMARGWHREPHVVGCSPGGNGIGPMRDLARFYAMLLARGALDGRRVLTPQTVEALTAPQRVGLVDVTFRHKIDWGLGFIVNSLHYGVESWPYGYGIHASRRTFGHSGRQSSTAFADPDADLVVALFVNGNPGDEPHTARFRELCEAIYEDLGLARPASGPP